MQPRLQEGELYVHYKKPDQQYRIIGIGKSTETEEEFVIYQPLYTDDPKYWIRPLEMFISEVEIEGIKKPRFTKVS